MQLADFGVTLHQFETDYGLRVAHFERPLTPISMRLAFASGSRFDPLGKEGVAHFAEHMIVSGSEKFATKSAVGEFIESLGGHMNAHTSSDEMCLDLDFADPDDIPKMLDFWEQSAFHSLFDPLTVESERGAIQAELSGRLSSPGEYIARLWRLVSYQGTEVGRDTLGSQATIAAISRDELLQYYRNSLTSDRSALVVSGGVTRPQLERYLSNVTLTQPSQSQILDYECIASREQPLMIKAYPKSEQAHLFLGFQTVPDSHPDAWPLEAMSRILGVGQTSRLYRQLRLDRGLVYHVRTNTHGWHGTGRLAVHTSCTRANLQQTLDVITDEFRRIVEHGVTVDELQHVQDYWQKSQKLRMQTSGAWTEWHVSDILFQTDRTIVDDLASLQAVTIADVNRVAKEYIKPDSWYLAVCGDVTEDQIQVNF